LKAVFTACREGLLVKLRVTAKSQREGLAGVHYAADGSAALRVRVRAVPEQGKANRAVIDTVAASLGLPKTSLSIKAGETSRNKTVLIAGNPDRLLAMISPQLKFLLEENK
jgi:uncharacterized protein (TIGR00251 family)